jgi:hypothetical protein
MDDGRGLIRLSSKKTVFAMRFTHSTACVNLAFLSQFRHRNFWGCPRRILLANGINRGNFTLLGSSHALAALDNLAT